MTRGFALPPLDGMQDEVRLQFLWDCVVSFADGALGPALEIGCYKGCSTVVLAQACARSGIGAVWAIDLFTGTPSWGQSIDTYDECRRRLAEFGLDHRVQLLRADSQELDWALPLSVLHVDGDHAYEAVAADLVRYVPWLAPGGIAVFDDYDGAHPGVVRAVHELLAADRELAIVAANNHRADHGSLCVQRRRR